MSSNSPASSVTSSPRSKSDPASGHNAENVIKWKFDENFDTKSSNPDTTGEKNVDITENFEITDISLDASKNDEIFLNKRGKGRPKLLSHERGAKKAKTKNNESQLSHKSISEADVSYHIYENEDVKYENGFTVGMSLEAVDPIHPNLFCVVNVSAVSGKRIRLNFDGYSDCFDFWVDIHSPLIFPPGWCQLNNKTLQPPYEHDDFDWETYLSQNNRKPSPSILFGDIGVAESGLVVGMKLVATEYDYPPTLPVRRISTIVDVMGQYILVGFDGSQEFSGFWARTNSPLLASLENFTEELEPPDDYQGEFSIERYLEETEAQIVPSNALSTRAPLNHRQGMRVEIVDAYNPDLIRQGTIALVRGYRLKIHLNGWPKPYDYWVDDDYEFIYPQGHCEKYNITLTVSHHPNKYKNIECVTTICSGQGHASGKPDSTHYSRTDCPYKDHVPIRHANRLIPQLRPEDSPVPIVKSSQTRDLSYPVETSSEATCSSVSARGTPPQKKRRRKISRQNNSLYRRSPSPGIRQITREEVENHYQLDDLFEPHNLPHVKEVASLLRPSIQPRKSEVMMWSCDQVAKFIAGISSNVVARCFIHNRIDGKALLLIRQIDLTDILKLKLGPALKIYYHILIFRDSNVLLNPLV